MKDTRNRRGQFCKGTRLVRMGDIDRIEVGTWQGCVKYTAIYSAGCML